MQKMVTCCDGCGKELVNRGDTYHLDLKTDEFWNSMELCQFELNNEFCKTCAIDIKKTLENIVNLQNQFIPIDKINPDKYVPTPKYGVCPTKK